MDEKENQIGLKRRCVLFDSGDDETIGALIKLKGKKRSKKSKVVPDGSENNVRSVVEDEEFGCMEDTLANFRKKLRGPKRDSGPQVGVGKDASLEPSCESTRDGGLDVNKILEVQPRESGAGGSPGDATVFDALKVKAKRKSKRLEPRSAAKTVARDSECDGNVDYWISESCYLPDGKKDTSELGYEALENSLAPLSEKVHSDVVWNSCKSSRLEKVKETKVFDVESKPNSMAVSLDLVHVHGQGSMNSTLIHQTVDGRLTEDLNGAQGDLGCADSKLELSSYSSVTNHLSRSHEMDGTSLKVILENSSLADMSRSRLRDCSGKIYNVQDGDINSETSEDLPGFNIEPPCSNNIHDRSCGVFSVDAENNCLLPLDGAIAGACNNKDAVDQMNSTLMPKTGKRICTSVGAEVPGFCLEQKCLRKRSKDLSQTNIKASKGLLDHTCPLNCNYPSEDDEVNQDLYSSVILDHQESCREETGVYDSEARLERVARNSRKCRHEDMAYEGDADWEILMQGQELLVSHGVVDKIREKINSSKAVDAENGKAAAVMAGLKARAVSPIEQIKFKELLKRKGGLQEYLECRNHILSVWNKNVSRILSLTDFGVSKTPLVGEGPHASLIRDVHTFLDQHGYVNFGVPSGKENVDNTIKHDSKILKSKETDGPSPTDLADAFIHGKENTYVKEINYDAFTDERMPRKCKREDGLVNLQALESSAPTVSEGCPPEESQLGSYPDPISQTNVLNMEYLCTIPSCKDADATMLPAMHLKSFLGRDSVPDVHVEVSKERPTVVSGSKDCEHRDVNNDSEPRSSIIIIGAGPAGLTAARHLQRQGLNVTVLEARSRIGGRVYTDRSSLSVPVDLGASIITGVEADVATERRPDPSSLISAQLGLELTVLNSDCPLYDIVTGQKVPADLDETLEAEYNSLLDDMVRLVAEKGEHAMKMSLEEGLEYGLKRCRVSHSAQDDMKIASDKYPDTVRSTRRPADDVLNAQDSKTKSSNPLERRVMDWHFAHLEYGCAALLQDVSLPNWNQDDVYGGFGGAHCMIKGGYSAVVESLGEGLCIYLDHVVTKISYDVKCHEMNNDLHNKVKISTSNGKEFSGDAVLVTVPLGCLKAETIKFSPPLPQWKYQSVQRLGFGVLNKVVLEFPEVFWDETIDYFGATAETTDQRGRCFMFWNVKKTVKAPVLIALVVGMAAIEGQNISPSDHVNHALLILRKLFGEDRVSDPVASVVTDWGRDPYCYGAYSYVSVGASGEDYDILGRPVENCLFFAGEATCKEHPDTVGGAMISGLREAIRIMDILKTGTDYTTEVEAMESAKRHLGIGKSEMRDIIERLEALEFSDGLCENSLDASRLLTRGSIVKDIFFTAKTSAGRLCLAKELLSLPVGFLKTFASTKEGLSVLNSWILDSLGKDGTQLLRHCVRILVLISTDLLAVRFSGIGKTVKEKVCVHTSRDIRAIASQLVNVWVELFRKDKASKWGLKLLTQSTTLDLKSKSSLVSGKPPRRTIHVAPESKGSSKMSASVVPFPSSERTKKVLDKNVKSETRIDPKADVQFSFSHGSIGSRSVVEEKNQEIPISEEESAAIAAAEEAQAAAIAAAKAYAASGVVHNTLLQLPKILSFHKFAMHEQWTHTDESNIRKNLSGAAIGKQDFLSDIDSRNCRVRDWSVDFSAAVINLENSRISVDNRSQQSHSNEIASQLNFKEHSGENAAVDSSIFTKAWVDSAGSVGIKDFNAIDRWQSQAAAASSGFSHGTMHLTDEEDSNVNSKLYARKPSSVAIESSASHIALNDESKDNQPRGAERLKHAVVDYVASLLMPLYKARKIDREGYKSIMKKTATKVMEHTNDVEKAMPVPEFLDFRRKNKIRDFVDKLIEKHMAMKRNAKSGSSGN